MNRSAHFALPVHESTLHLVKGLLEKFKDLWYACELTEPELGRTYTLHEKIEREHLFRGYLALLDSAAKKRAAGEDELRAAKERIYRATVDFTRSALDMDERHVEAVRSAGFIDVAAEFTRTSRRYDPQLSEADIFQASRNVWSMNLMQALLGLPVRMTPSVFAYSLLYPYSDNYIDDPSTSLTTKLSFNDRFYHRLKGERIVLDRPQEKQISELIGMIEGEYPRSDYPEVYESLQAIHLAQSKSLRLLNPGASPYEVDVLGLCFEKGGASVLADGYLVAGRLSAAQQEFMFYYGTFTQLIDDLEDVEADLQRGILTVFSHTARRWPLDAITNRSFHFWERVVQALKGFDTPSLHPLIEMIGKYAPLALVAEAGVAGKYYTRPYIRRLEEHCPFRFSFLIQERRRLARRGVSPLALIEALR